MKSKIGIFKRGIEIAGNSQKRLLDTRADTVEGWGGFSTSHPFFIYRKNSS